MTAAFTILALLGLSTAAVNMGEIRRDPDTKGWGVGFGFLTFIVFGLAAIWTGA